MQSLSEDYTPTKKPVLDDLGKQIMNAFKRMSCANRQDKHGHVRLRSDAHAHTAVWSNID